MNAREAAVLCRLAKAMCPQQAIDEHTPDAWHLLLDDIPFDEAKAALAVVCKARPFVAPAEIRAEVRRVRYKRIEEFGYIQPPPHLTWAEEQDYILAVRERVASGALTREAHDAEQRALGFIGDREMPAIEGVFRRVTDRAETQPTTPRARECETGDNAEEAL